MSNSLISKKLSKITKEKTEIQKLKDVNDPEAITTG